MVYTIKNSAVRGYCKQEETLTADQQQLTRVIRAEVVGLWQRQAPARS